MPLTRDNAAKMCQPALLRCTAAVGQYVPEVLIGVFTKQRVIVLMQYNL